LNARGSKPSDYVRYLAYEQNLENLKRKRVQRLGVKNLGYNGPRRTFFIFERATRKFPHDIRLWVEYLNYTKAQKANKRLGKVLTTVLRLHPTNPDLWLYAAKYAIDRNDSPSAARSYFQRALRFCPKQKQLWLEYCRMELLFIVRITENLENMGVRNTGLIDNESKGEEDEMEDQEGGAVETDDLELPESEQRKLESLDTQALKQMASTPALSGSIPKAVFDAAMIEFRNDPNLAEQFFDVAWSFPSLSCSPAVLGHILHNLTENNPSVPSTFVSSYRKLLFGVNPNSAEFPVLFMQAVQEILQPLGQEEDPIKKSKIAEKALFAILPYIVTENLDDEVRHVLEIIAQDLIKNLVDDGATVDIIHKLRDQKQLNEDVQVGRLVDRFVNENKLALTSG
jgi:U3 small nucleolar RNA-associated protein 6